MLSICVTAQRLILLAYKSPFCLAIMPDTSQQNIVRSLRPVMQDGTNSPCCNEILSVGCCEFYNSSLLLFGWSSSRHSAWQEYYLPNTQLPKTKHISYWLVFYTNISHSWVLSTKHESQPVWIAYVIFNRLSSFVYYDMAWLINHAHCQPVNYGMCDELDCQIVSNVPVVLWTSFNPTPPPGDHVNKVDIS